MPARPPPLITGPALPPHTYLLARPPAVAALLKEVKQHEAVARVQGRLVACQRLNAREVDVHDVLWWWWGGGGGMSGNAQSAGRGEEGRGRGRVTARQSAGRKRPPASRPCGTPSPHLGGGSLAGVVEVLHRLRGRKVHAGDVPSGGGH